MKLINILFLAITIACVSCGTRDSNTYNSTTVTTVDQPAPAQQDMDIQVAVEEDHAEVVVSIFGTKGYIEQGSAALDSVLDIKCRISQTQSEGKVVLKIITGAEGSNLRVYREKKSSSEEEFVDLKANTVYYLYTDITDKQIFGVRSDTEADFAKCAI